MLYEFRSADRKYTDVISGKLKNLSAFEDKDKMRFVRELLQRSKSTNWQRRTTPEGQHFEDLTKAFLSAYQSDIGNLFNVDENTIKNWAQNGVKDDEVEPIAATLVNNM